jgi:hypothetical protein
MEARDPQRRAKAAQIVRAANWRILAMTEGLKWGDREQAVAFFCECGCRDVIPMTPSRYRSLDGAWLPGHKPEPSPAS